jgi:hypothetical protein
LGEGRALNDGVSKANFTAGVTGRRKLPQNKLPFIAQSINGFFIKMQKDRGDSGITVLSSLAEGADMMCAKTALDMGFRLAVPLPMNTSEYRRDFSENAAAEFDCLLAAADEVFTVTPEETVPDYPARGFYYRQAGIYVVKHCDVLLAIWDGVKNDTPDGAGTWETIKLAEAIGIKIKIIYV